VQFAIDDEARGVAIASELLQRRLVACVQTIGPMTSRYWWERAITESQEWLFVAKTTREHAAAVTALVRELHSYEVPEIVVSEIDTAFAPYAAWIAAETVPPGDDRP
jgi:periplasmic divalent cation tolerance protein